MAAICLGLNVLINEYGTINKQQQTQESVNIA